MSNKRFTGCSINILHICFTVHGRECLHIELLLKLPLVGAEFYFIFSLFEVFPSATQSNLHYESIPKFTFASRPVFSVPPPHRCRAPSVTAMRHN